MVTSKRTMQWVCVEQALQEAWPQLPSSGAPAAPQRYPAQTPLQWYPAWIQCQWHSGRTLWQQYSDGPQPRPPSQWYPDWTPSQSYPAQTSSQPYSAQPHCSGTQPGPQLQNSGQDLQLTHLPSKYLHPKGFMKLDDFVPARPVSTPNCEKT